MFDKVLALRVSILILKSRKYLKLVASHLNLLSYMKRLFFIFGILIVIACNKVDKGTSPSTDTQEEAIKFTTNLDTGVYNISDTLPLIISVSSKLPNAGLIYSVTTTWTDSAKQIFKLDTNMVSSNLNLNIPKHNKAGKYSISITVTSKSKPSNSANKTLEAINNPLARFMGYKVASNARQLGSDYWIRGTGVMIDLIVQTFQPTNYYPNSFGYQRNAINAGFAQATCGDFNNDGFVDVFTPGAAPELNFSFLIWNTNTKVFEPKNLFNDKSFQNLISTLKTIPLYLNEDNYTDLIVIGDGETPNTAPPWPNDPVMLVISDGKGGYDYKKIETNESNVFSGGITPNKFGGDVGDLNNDGNVDLFLACGPYTYIYWGIKGFPYFKKDGNAAFASQIKDIGTLNNNSFGEKCFTCGGASSALISDLNNDNQKDILYMANEGEVLVFPNKNDTSYHKFLINQGNGRFNSNSPVYLPMNDLKKISENLDYIVDDLNGDGLKDIISSSQEQFDFQIFNSNNSAIFANEFFAYIQQKDGSYKIDKSFFQYSSAYITKKNNRWGKKTLQYFDYNGDGRKDISYIDASNGDEVGLYNNSTLSGCRSTVKTVFIREGNQFVEKDYFQFDPYAKSLLPILIARWK